MESSKLLDQLSAPRNRFDRHPLVRNLPTLPPDSSDYCRIRASIASEGIREPLKCVQENGMLLVLDGLHRLRIAEELGIAEIPYQIFEGKDPVLFVCASVVRAGWNKSALAYRMWPFFADAACARGGKRKAQSSSKGNHFPLTTSAEIAAHIGVSEKLVDQAKSAHAYFAKHPDKKEELEPLILTGLLPLHKLKESSNRREKSPVPSFGAIRSLFKRLPEPFENWDQLGAAEQQTATNLVTEALRKLPKDVQIATLETLEVVWR